MFVGSTRAGVDDSSSPIQIEADRMVSQEEKNTVVFIGNVDARQDDVVIRSDEMTVIYFQKNNEKGKEGSGRVKKLICIGNVEITRGDWLGTGKRMDYYSADRKAVLSGDAKTWKGDSMVSGKTITYFLDEGRSIVEQEKDKKVKGSGRVKAVIIPGSDK